MYITFTIFNIQLLINITYTIKIISNFRNKLYLTKLSDCKKIHLLLNEQCRRSCVS